MLSMYMYVHNLFWDWFWSISDWLFGILADIWAWMLEICSWVWTNLIYPILELLMWLPQWLLEVYFWITVNLFQPLDGLCYDFFGWVEGIADDVLALGVPEWYPSWFEMPFALPIVL